MSVFAAPAPRALRTPAIGALWMFAAVAVGLGAGRAVTTTYVPVLLERIADRPGLIGAVMLVNAAAGFLVPLIAGLWSDRRGRRTPFIVGGALVSSGGLLAVALGNATSYAVLALAAATVYIGLNAASTAHRALVVERFAAGRRAAATGAQEGAMLAGALAGTLVGGALIDGSSAGLFVLWAIALPLLALPTLAWNRSASPAASAEPEEAHGASLRLLADVLHQDGARQVLLAQILWVAAYAALTPFMVLYAEDVLGLRAAQAGVLLAAFGLITGAGLVLGSRLPAERLREGLLAGVALLGGGLLAATAASTVPQAAVPFAAAALGAGLTTATGFPYFSRFIPDGQAGRYAGAFFAARAVASAAALPVAGGLIEVTGSYRALLGMGALGLVALVPLVRVRAAAVTVAPALAGRPAIRSVAAVMPVFASDRVRDVALETLRHVDRLVLVDDGAPPRVAAALDELARRDGVHVLRLGANHGKGTAVAAGIEAALAASPDAVLVIDSDGQHPPELVPQFVAAAAGADVVIGNRRQSRMAMPLRRRLGNAFSNAVFSVVARRRLPDAQNGMRLFRASALAQAQPPQGRYEAETRHLKSLIRAGQRVAWVPMPAIYDGEPSGFRPIADSARVMRAVLAPTRPAGPVAPARGPAVRTVLAEWAAPIGLGMVLAWSVAAALPVLGGADEQLFLAVNGLGDGPEWLYQALDPHSRNYTMLAAVVAAAVLVTTRRLLYAVGAVVTMLAAGIFADLVLEVVQLGVDRPRPEEALGAEVARSHGRTWAHIPSFPSGHLLVTAALVAAGAAMAPLLRLPLLVYLAAIAATRMAFGAHFPLDVVLGWIVGWQVGLFSAALMHAAGLIGPVRLGRRPRAVGAPVPAH